MTDSTDGDIFDDDDEEELNPEMLNKAKKQYVQRFWIACEFCLKRETVNLSKRAWSESCARSLYLLGHAIVEGGYTSNADAMQFKIGAAERAGWNAILLGIKVAQSHDISGEVEALTKTLEAEDTFAWCEVFRAPIPESFFENDCEGSRPVVQRTRLATSQLPVVAWDAKSRWRELRRQFQEISTNPIHGFVGKTEWTAKRKRRLADGHTGWELRDGWVRGDENKTQLQHVSMLAGELLANCPPSDADDLAESMPDAASRWWTYVGTVHHKFVAADGTFEMLQCTDGNGNPHPIEVLEIPNILAESKRVCDLIIAKLEGISTPKGNANTYEEFIALEAEKVRETDRRRKEHLANFSTVIRGEPWPTNAEHRVEKSKAIVAKSNAELLTNPTISGSFDECEPPQSFVGLYHWCNTFRSSTFEVKHFPLQQFQSHLHRLGTHQTVEEYLTSISTLNHSEPGDGESFWEVDHAKRFCVTLAERIGELPESWTSCTESSLSQLIEIPRRPLRELSDLRNWLMEFRRQVMLLNPKSRDHTCAIRAWVYFEQAAYWLELNGISRPIAPDDRGNAVNWFEIRTGEPPKFEPAIRAIENFLQIVSKSTTPALQATPEVNAQPPKSDQTNSESTRGTLNVPPLSDNSAANGELPKGKRGRRKGSVGSDVDVDFDRRVFEAWNNGHGQYTKFEELAREFNIDREVAWAAKERHRKRLKKSETNPKPKRRQAE